MMTKNFWAFACTSSTKNGYPGEGFVAISPKGEKYYFDWVVSRPYSALSKRYANYAHSTARMGRLAVYFLVSRIEDRFGNWVSYTYSGDKLSQITSNDGVVDMVDGGLARPYAVEQRPLGGPDPLFPVEDRQSAQRLWNISP